jgi:hypothetical protein
MGIETYAYYYMKLFKGWFINLKNLSTVLKQINISFIPYY